MMGLVEPWQYSILIVGLILSIAVGIGFGIQAWFDRDK